MGSSLNPLLQALVDGKPAAEVPAHSPMNGARSPIQKLRYSHEAMIDILIAEPWISQNELAARFDMSASWISTIICSDLFQSKLAERRDQLVDPELRMSVKTQFEGLLARSIEVLRHKFNREPDQIPDQLAVQVAKMAGSSLGYGVRDTHVSISETHLHLEELGNNLVGLLRRHKAVAAEEIIDGQVMPPTRAEGGQSPNGNGSLPPAGEPST